MFPFAQEFDAVVIVIVLRRSQPEQSEHAGPLFILPKTVDVKTVERKQHSHRLADRQLHVFLLRNLSILKRNPRHRLPALPTQQQTTLRIFSHRNPRAIDFRVGFQKHFNLESRQCLQLIGFRFRSLHLFSRGMRATRIDRHRNRRRHQDRSHPKAGKPTNPTAVKTFPAFQNWHNQSPCVFDPFKNS